MAAQTESSEPVLEASSLAPRFEAYEREVREYGRTWFRSDAAAHAVIDRDPEVRTAVSRLLVKAATIGTETIYRCGDRWVPERLDVHRKLLAQLFGAEDDEASGDPVDLPQAVILMGMPGAGKSSLLRPVAHELIRRTPARAQLVIDADVVRASMPEYRDGRGSEVVQPETAYVVNHQVIETACRRRANLVLDTVGDPARSLAEARYLVRSGWSVWCLCASVDVEVAVARAQHRALTTGRYVPLAYLRSVGDRPVRAYRSLLRSGVPIAGGVLVDTNGGAGHRPVVLASTDDDLFGRPGQPVAIWPADAGPARAAGTGR